MEEENLETVPAEEVEQTEPAENTGQLATETTEEQSSDETQPGEGQPETDNLVTIPAERLQDYKRKINGSKEEALRLKRKAEQLEEELRVAKTAQTVQYPESNVEQLKILARQAGIPLKEDLEALQVNTYQQEKQAAVEAFLQKHPEYNQPGKAQSDELWEQLEEEVGNYVNPSRGADYLKLMDKAHKVIHYNPIVERERGKALGMAQAKVSATSAGGGSGKSVPPSKKTARPQQAVIDGFAAIRPEAFTS